MDIITAWGESVKAQRINGLDRMAAFTAIICLLIFCPILPSHSLLPQWLEMALPEQANDRTSGQSSDTLTAHHGGEHLLAGYVGNPIYYRSNISFKGPDGTNLKLEGLGWDGDALRFPIDGGVRYVRWGDRYGFMVDFLHNKAIARLGKGAHGRKLKHPVVEEVEATGTFKGKPVPNRVLLTDIFDRLEFTHGHNMLFFTGMYRLSSPKPNVRPYFGLGAGFAIPHTEVWFAGEGRKDRTNEYQFAGPAAQMLFGIEIQVNHISYFIEYKFSYAWIWGAITSDQSWKNWDMPGDLWRQFNRWSRGEEPKRGTFATTLGAHQLNIGAGYRWEGAVKP